MGTNEVLAFDHEAATAIEGGLVAYVSVFAVAFLSVPASAIFGPCKASPVTFWGIGALGVTAIVLGVMLTVDLRGSADAYVSFIKDYKPMGVDYSNSFVANPKFVRIFGALDDSPISIALEPLFPLWHSFADQHD